MLNATRDRVLIGIERFPVATQAVVDAAARLALRSGAVPEVVAEAQRSPDRPLPRRLQMIQWARAVQGRGRLPRHFSPGEHIQGSDARAAATGALKTGAINPIEAERERIRIDDAQPLDELCTSVEEDLTAEFERRSTRPQRGTGLDPGLQSEIIGEVTDALGTIEIRPFLMSGTLLGVIRDGGFMRHDHDIDLGLMAADDLDDIAASIGALPDYEVHQRAEWIVVEHTSGVHVDLFRHFERDGLWWHSTTIHEWWNTPFSLVETTVDGRRMWIPDNPHRYLDENYGEWSRPVVFYDISFDTPNRRFRHDAPAIRHLHSNCLSGLRTGNRWLVESSVRELRDHFGIDLSANLAPSALLEPTESKLPTGR